MIACAVCFGQSDAPMAIATNMGILVMLGVVAVVLGGFGSFLVYLNRQARRAALGPQAAVRLTAGDVLAGVGQVSDVKGAVSC